jgi:TetR/AcrR family transcriptional regulator, transcriptional repressor for nem operon
MVSSISLRRPRRDEWEALVARYKGDHWDKTHDAIITAAAAMLRERGYDGTSVADVMKAAGLTHGGFYAHFDDKTAMLASATERAFVQSPKNFDVLSSMANAKGDAGFIAEKYLAETQVNDVAGSCPGGALMSEVRRQPETVRAAFMDGARHSARALGAADGLAKSKRQPEAWAALSLLMGALALMRAATDAQTKAAISKQAAEALRQLAKD